MTATIATPAQPAQPVQPSPTESSVHAPVPARDDTQSTSVDRLSPRWLVRVVLESTHALGTTHVRSVCVMIRDRNSGTFPVFSVWSEWHDMPAIGAHIPSGPMLRGADTVAAELADALLAALEHDAAACLAAFLPTNDAAHAQPPTQRERQQYQLIRDTAWHEGR